MTDSLQDKQPLWFFMSYARVDGGPQLHKFYKALAEEVAKKGGVRGYDPERPQAIGFLDVESTEPGDRWRPNIEDALGRCAVFICLLSPSLLKSPYCRKELQAFRQRIEDVSQGDLAPPLVLPLLWEDPEVTRLADMPSDIRAIHMSVKPSDFGAEYERSGLMQMVRRKKHEDDYYDFLVMLAKRIVALKKEHDPAPRSVRPLDSIEIDAAGDDEKRGRQTSRSRMVHFAFLAARRDQLRQASPALVHYGQDALRRDWKPYEPDEDEDVGWLAQLVATQERHSIDILAPDDDKLLDRVSEAEKRNTPVLIVVDPRSLREVETFQKVMSSYDERVFANSGVLIAWSESSEPRANARQTVESVFNRTIAFRSGYYDDSIESKPELTAQLSKALIEVRARIRQRGLVYGAMAGNTPIPSVPPPGGER